MSARLPDFVLIGAMKCGTSTLHEQLALRSGLFLTEPKEPCFFSDDPVYSRGIDWYRSLFAEARADQRCGESSTHYTKLPTHPRSVERMRAHLERPRLVYVMRDPLERVVSQYVHEWSEREVRGALEEALRAHPRFAAYSAYARQLEPFLAAFGADSVLPVFFERMLAQPDAELERVCRFIGDPTPNAAKWRTDLPPQNVSSDRLQRSALREGMLRIPGVRALKDALPPSLRERLKSRWRLPARPELSESARSALEAELDLDLARLGRWLGRELRCRDWQARVREGDAPEWVAPPPGPPTP